MPDLENNVEQGKTNIVKKPDVGFSSNARALYGEPVPDPDPQVKKKPAQPAPKPTPSPTPVVKSDPVIKPIPAATPKPTPTPKSAGVIAEESFENYSNDPTHALNPKGLTTIANLRGYEFKTNDTSVADTLKKSKGIGLGTMINMGKAAVSKHKGVDPEILNGLKNEVISKYEDLNATLKSTLNEAKGNPVDNLKALQYSQALETYKSLEKFYKANSNHTNPTNPIEFLNLYKELRDQGLVQNFDIPQGKKSLGEKIDNKINEYVAGRVTFADITIKTKVEAALTEYRANPSDSILKLKLFQLIHANEK